MLQVQQDTHDCPLLAFAARQMFANQDWGSDGDDATYVFESEEDKETIDGETDGETGGHTDEDDGFKSNCDDHDVHESTDEGHKVNGSEFGAQGREGLVDQTMYNDGEQEGLINQTRYDDGESAWFGPEGGLEGSFARSAEGMVK